MNRIVTFTVSHLKLLKSVYHFEEMKNIGFHWLNHQPFRDQNNITILTNISVKYFTNHAVDVILKTKLNLFS